jgi:hypothetical protein
MFPNYKIICAEMRLAIRIIYFVKVKEDNNASQIKTSIQELTQIEPAIVFRTIN